MKIGRIHIHPTAAVLGVGAVAVCLWTALTGREYAGAPGARDLTAVALAALLNADRCIIYTDVDGVYDKDPRVHPDAVKYKHIGYDDMLDLCHRGAQVLHDRCVELAKECGIRIEVRSAFTDEAGTMVGVLE